MSADLVLGVSVKLATGFEQSMYLNTQDRGTSDVSSTGMARLVLGLLYLWLCAAPCQPAVYAAGLVSANVLNELPFDWQDEHGAATQLSQWRGKTVLLTMAYPTCREVCSYALHRLEELQQSADRAGTPIEVVVISYDPKIGPGTWSNYRRHHHLDRANWHFLTGSIASTRQFAKALQFPYWRYDEHIVHDFKLLVIGPDGEIAKTLTWATRNDDLFGTAAVSCPSSDARDCKI